MSDLNVGANLNPTFNKVTGNLSDTPQQPQAPQAPIKESAPDTFEKKGLTKKQKIGIAAGVAAAATAIGVTIAAAVRGKKINGDAAKLGENIKEGFKSIFTKAGREAYKAATKKATTTALAVTDKPAQEVGNAVKDKVAKDAPKITDGKQEAIQREVAARQAQEQAQTESAKAFQAKMDELHGINRPVKSAEESAQVFIKDEIASEAAARPAKEQQEELAHKEWNDFHGIGKKPAVSAKDSAEFFERRFKIDDMMKGAKLKPETEKAIGGFKDYMADGIVPDSLLEKAAKSMPEIEKKFTTDELSKISQSKEANHMLFTYATGTYNTAKEGKQIVSYLHKVGKAAK